MKDHPGLVVIGQGPAGTAAAKAFRERDAHTPVTLLTHESWRCYSRPRLPDVVAGEIQPEDITLYPESWYRERNIQLQFQTLAVNLDTSSRRIFAAEGGSYQYTDLILAPGGVPLWPQIGGLPHPKVLALRTADDALTVRACARGKDRAVVLGGGLLGLEAGYALIRLGVHVTVVEIAPRLLPRQLDEMGSSLLQDRLQALGFEFALQAKVENLGPELERVDLHLEDGRRITAELAVISAGVQPRVELAQKARLRLGAKGVVVDDSLRTSDPHVFAAGDVAEWNGQVLGLWPVAQAMGRVAGANAAGARERYAGHIPATQLKIRGVEMWSQGDIHSPSERTVTRGGREEGFWIKLFFRQERLVGSIQVGKTRGAQQLKRLMERGVSTAGYETQLLEDEFDFSRIPGNRD